MCSNKSYRIPREILLAIVEYMALEDVLDDRKLKAFFRVPDSIPVPPHIRAWVRLRLDPRMRLRELVQEPEMLLEVMAASNSFIAGPRAADFFAPGLCREHSSWHFYCVGNSIQRMALAVAFTDAGFVLYTGGHDDEDDLDSDVRHLRFFELTRTKNGNISRVKIIQSDLSTPVDTVLQFHSSIAQCYITCDQAVSLRSSLTRNNKSVEIAQINRRISLAHRKSVDKYRRWGVEFLAERGVAELLCQGRTPRRLSSRDVLTYNFTGGVKDPRVAKAVEIRKMVCSKLVWIEGLYGGTGMVVTDVSTMFESKMKALEEVRQEYTEANKKLKEYIYGPLIARGIIKQHSCSPRKGIFVMGKGETDETLKAFSYWLNTLDPVTLTRYH